MDILRWLVSVVRCVAGRTAEPAPKPRKLLGHHKGIALHVVKDDPRPGDVSITGQMDWLYMPDGSIGVRRIRTWITARDTNRGCGCGCGYSCGSGNTGRIRVMRDYPYNNGSKMVENDLSDFATALKAARDAAEREIDKQLHENREEQEQQQRQRNVNRSFSEGVAQLFDTPAAEARPEPAALNTSQESPEDEIWTRLFEDLQAVESSAPRPGGGDAT